MMTLLSRLQQKYIDKLNSLDTGRQHLLIEILDSQFYWTDLTLKEAFDIYLYLELKTFSDVITIFADPKKVD